MRENFTDLDIIAVIKSKRLRWLGHVLKRNNASITIKSGVGKTQGRRPRERLRLRRKDRMGKGLRRLGAEMGAA